MAEIEFTVDNLGVGTLLIDRPHRRNALSWEAMKAFAAAIEKAHGIANLRVLIITGAGDTFFSGGDIHELIHYPTHEDGERLAAGMGETLKRLEELPQPSIAAINGPGRGGGAEIAVACDLRVMSEEASIGFVQAKLGMIPGWGGGQRLMRIVGYARALELLTTAKVIRAQEAFRIGLVNEICPDALRGARELAEKIAGNSPAAVRSAKDILRFGCQNPAQKAFDHERKAFPPLWASEFRIQAMETFLRRPKIQD